VQRDESPWDGGVHGHSAPERNGGDRTCPASDDYQLMRETIWITRAAFVPVRPVTR